MLELYYTLVDKYPFVYTISYALIAASIAYVVSKLVLRFSVFISKKTKTTFDNYLVRIISKPFVFTATSLALYASVYTTKHPFVPILWSIIFTLLIVLWSVFAKRLTKYLMLDSLRNHNEESLIQPQTIPLFQNIVVISITVLSVYLIFTAWHIDMSAWLASAGIIGIAVGFAAKDTLANLFSGVFILADAPYKIDDYIVLDSGERGKVTAIGIRSTRILTRDDVEITIPNSVMGNSKIQNQSGGHHVKFRFRLKVGVAYGSDTAQVEKILVDCAINEKLVCSDPEPRLRFREFGDSSINFELLCWVENPELKGLAIHNLNTDIYNSLNANNIEIPYPKRDVYLK